MDITVTEIMELADMHAYAKITDGTPAEQRPRNLLERRMQQIVSHVFGLECQLTGARLEIASLQAQLEAVGAGGVGALMAAPAQPVAVPAVEPVGFDHKTAANFLNKKTVTDDEIRLFVAHSRWAHDDRDWLRNTIADLLREIARRDAEIALLKTSLLDAEARQPLTDAEVSSVYFEVLGTVRIQDPTLINRLVRAIEAAHGITGKAEGAQ